MERIDNEWTEYTPAPRGLQYIDTPYGSRIWRSSAGQIVLEPAPVIEEIKLELEPQTLSELEHQADLENPPKPKPKKKPRSKKK